ncbi:Fic family protein [Patescibacteria group bacterium]|nr:Fic family protein [Patescibacteria group bacterium]
MYSPKYTITQTILSNIGKIEAAREVIENAALVPAWEAKFRTDALVRTVHHGTHIEGNPLTRDETQRLVEVYSPVDEPWMAASKAEVVARERDIQEIINYRNVMAYLDELTKKESEGYTENVLLKIHGLTVERILPPEAAGVYRATQVVIKDAESGEVTFRPPVAIEVPYQIDDLFSWLRSPDTEKHHPVLRAGIVHYELVRIHPFTDGNGRAARAMALLVLLREGYDVKRFFSIEEYFDQHSSEYYGALQQVARQEFDLSPWLEYFTLGLVVELMRIKDQVLKLSRDLRLKGELGGRQVALSERQIALLEAMQANDGRLAVREARNILPMVSRDTIIRDLNDLIGKNVVKRRGVTKGSFYILA